MLAEKSRLEGGSEEANIEDFQPSKDPTMIAEINQASRSEEANTEGPAACHDEAW